MPYFHNSLESKNSKVSDPLFDVLLSLFHFRFKNSIHEDDQQPLRNLVNTLYDNNKIGIDRKGFVVYIWNPELAKRFINKKSY